MTEDDKSDLDSKLNDLKTIYENRDFESMDESLETLNKTWQEISTRLYEETQTEDVNSDESSMDVDSTDVEFEEVKE